MNGRKKVIEKYYLNIHKVKRKEFTPIINWIKPESKVLDVGCGEGSLGKVLRERKNCKVYGVDISAGACHKAQGKGVIAEVKDIDEGLDFAQNEFDYVILSDVLEHVYRPNFVLKEALRVGKSCIVASPNFAFIKSRFELLTGKFPKTPLFGYQWYNTQHIHLFSYKDFMNLVKKLGATVSKKWFYTPKIPDLFGKLFPNLFAIVFVVELNKNKDNENTFDL